MADSVTRFGLRLLSDWRREAPEDNIVFSPLSLASAFLLLYPGARGTTKRELEDVFGFSGDRVVEKLLAKLEQFSGDSIASLANRLYAEQSLELKQAYVQSIGAHSIEQVDFKTAFEAVRIRINDWVTQKTSGLIPDLMPAGTLNPESRLVAVNALYFKGKWCIPFPVTNTRNETFHGVRGDEVVPFMVLHRKTFMYKEVHSLDGVVIRLHYRDSHFSMNIFLPNRRDGWMRAEAELHQFFDAAFGNKGFINTEITELRMPKWELTVTVPNAGNLIKDMGLHTAFSDIAADFGDITETEPVCVSDVVHKAKIIVDEEGTEAAAATAVANRTARSTRRPQARVIIDRPFLYCIMDRSDGTVLFQGTQTSIQA